MIRSRIFRLPKQVPLALVAVFVAGAGACTSSQPALSDVDASAPVGPFADFVEPDFPFITGTVDARRVGPSFPDDNAATRGVVLLLGDSTYAVFDPDLLRMSIAWRGEFLPMVSMAQVSYGDSLNKNNRIPAVPGGAVFATGVYPGWATGTPGFTDPRQPGPYEADPGRGPLPASQGRWEGVYVVGGRAVLAYSVAGAEVRELPGVVTSGNQVAVTRTIRVGAPREPLTLVAAETRGAERVEATENRVVFHEGAGDTVTVVAVVGAPRGASLRAVENRYATLTLPAGAPALFRVVHWRGPEAALAGFEGLLGGEPELIEFEEGGPPHWEGVVTTSAEIAPDTADFVVDEITLPIGNIWQRNVRPSDLAFYEDGRAVVTTYEGDVWIVEGLEGDLDEIRWRRFASGLYEPMSVEVVDDEIYVYSRSGLVRPRDLNADGEADFYENFSDLSIQTMESREFPLSMGKKPGGGFYLTRGGALDNGPRTSPAIAPGFRAGSRYSGSVVEISEDGRSLRVVATGLREPFLGVEPETGMITTSDQQGNFVPSTPIYRIEEGAYYGVVPTAHSTPVPTEIEDAVVWIPHEVDQSGAGQAWVPEGSMGFGEDVLMHVSFGRPGVFRVYFDEGVGGQQGAVVSLVDDFAAPLLKGEFNPADGQLYVAGFNIWGSRSMGVRTLARVRHTDQPSLIPEEVSMGEQGVLLRFGVPLDPESAQDAARYAVSRWNYQRTEQYGSGHFKLDGSAGEERLPVAAAHLSDDRRSLLLVVPDMRRVMQLQLAYNLRSESGAAMTDTLYMTVNRVAPLELEAAGLRGVDWRASISAAGAVQGPSEAAASADQGLAIFQRVGCIACHSVDGSTAGKLGPTLLGVFGSTQPLADGTTVTADAEYIRRSIADPGAQIVRGYEEGMPAYLGVLSDTEIESLVQYIQTLRN